jgi:hypothetical protein
MASGILAQGSLTSTLTSYYTCPSNTTAFITVNITNQASSTITTNINLSNTSSENLGGYIEFSSSIADNQALEKTGIVLRSNQQILLSSNNASSNFVIFGYERTL